MTPTRTNESKATRELDRLTDSLSSLIRWRHCDYAAILRAELALLAAPAEDGRESARPLSH